MADLDGDSTHNVILDTALVKRGKAKERALTREEFHEFRQSIPQDLDLDANKPTATVRGPGRSVYLIGGAALSLRYIPDRGLTDDIDARIHPSARALGYALEIADNRGWGGDWLNTHAETCIPIAKDPGWESLYDDDCVSVWVASPECLLPMKLKVRWGQTQAYRDRLESCTAISETHRAMTAVRSTENVSTLPRAADCGSAGR